MSDITCCIVQEGEALGAYGEWVPVDKTAEKPAASSKISLTTATLAKAASSGETSAEINKQLAFVADKDSVFPDPPLQVRSLSMLCLYCVYTY